MSIIIHYSNTPKLLALLNESEITIEEKSLWADALTHCDEVTAKTILTLLEREPEQLNFLTENLSTKILASKSSSNALWKKIGQEEQLYLDSI